ncbi:MAG: DUF2844 domain-containing protein [Acidobacteria bacterium]|nr:MAG: DUF2844 domain-containing protein [Acidobacteriota bacterium]
MRKIVSVFLLATVALAGVLSATPPPLPVLGQPLPAIAGQALTGRRQLEQAGVSVRQYQTPRGVTLRAYASANGVVFGMAWQGPVPPDLESLLANNYAAYRKAASEQRHRGPVTIAAGNLVVQLSGHMRNLRGRAFLTDKIPAQLSAAVVR